MIRRLLIVAIALCAMVLVAYGGSAAPFQCVSGNNVWKNDSGGAYTAPSGYIISAIWVKAGQNCYELPHACYAIASGGVGYDYVEVVGAGGCQELSHLEGTYATVATPTEVPTQISPTPTLEVTKTPTATPILSTATPTTTSTLPPTATPPITPYPTKECQIEHCGGLG